MKLRILSGIIGAIIGLLTGFAIAMLFGLITSHGSSDGGGAMIVIVTAPVGFFVGIGIGLYVAERLTAKRCAELDEESRLVDATKLK